MPPEMNVPLLSEYSVTTRNVIHCMDALALLRSLPSGSVDAVITDPPFGTKFRVWDIDPPEMAWREMQRVCPTGPIALFGYAQQLFRWAKYFEDMRLIAFIVWHKSNEPIVSKGLTRVHQDIAVWGHSLAQIHADRVREPYQHALAMSKFFGSPSGRIPRSKKSDSGRRCNDLWTINVPFHGFNSYLRLHPNQKPDAVINRLVLLLSNPGNLICDPFAGSGTTALVARSLNRDFIACDLSLEYVELARRRLAHPFTLPMFETLGVAT